MSLREYKSAVSDSSLGRLEVFVKLLRGFVPEIVKLTVYNTDGTEFYTKAAK